MDSNEKWAGFSRRVWGHLLTWPSVAVLLLSLATPETVATAMTPFVEFAAALGWTIDPEHQERALRAVLSLSAIVGVVAKIRARVAPDNATLTAAPAIRS